VLAATRSAPEYSAPNLGISFRLVQIGGAGGARLTRTPVPDTAASKLGLEAGDTICFLDSLPIRAAVDVLGHHGQTRVEFINVRTGFPRSAVVELPDSTPPPAGTPREYFAANLGIYYRFIAHRGEIGARLSRSASANTPAGTLQLVRGDMIIKLDDEPIRKPNDVLNHVDQTRVEFVDIHTGRLRTASVQLPPLQPPSDSR
jgi:C-terminal processing protease CtpA/Prc